ncbi:MAG: DUF11 domain-containing protein [Blastocatellia bacterium]
MSVRLLFLLISLMTAVPVYAQDGAIVIDGTDANEHGYSSSDGNHGGWLYMQRVLEALAARRPAQAAKIVVALTPHQGRARAAIESAFNLSSLKLGLPLEEQWQLKMVDCPSLTDSCAALVSYLSNLSIENTGILYIPTYGLLEESTDLTLNEMQTINEHDQKIARFCKVQGGALFAMGESGPGHWDWLPALLPGVQVHDHLPEGIETPISLTEEGTSALLGLPDAEIGFAQPWHNSFEWEAATLQVLGTAPLSASAPSDQNVIIASKVTLADLGIAITALPNPAKAGASISYTITVRNDGPSAATQVSIGLALAPSLSSIICQPADACRETEQALAALLGTLPPGASQTLTIQAVVNCAIADGAMLTTAATVRSATPDPKTDNNRAAALTPVVAPTTLTLDTQRLNFGELSVGATNRSAALSFTVSNTGVCAQPLAFQLLQRASRDARILNPNLGDCSRNQGLAHPGDCRFFTITDTAAAAPRAVVAGSSPIVVPAGATQRYEIGFGPETPAFTSQTGGLPSDLVLPERPVTLLLLTLNQTTARSLRLSSRIVPEVYLVDPNVTLTQSGKIYTIECTVYDSAPEDVKSVQYDFRNGADLIDSQAVAVSEAIAQKAQNGELIRGQSFKIRQRFSVPGKIKVTSVQVTVRGGSSVVGPVTAASASVAAAASVTRIEMKPLTLKPLPRERRAAKRQPNAP